MGVNADDRLGEAAYDIVLAAARAKIEQARNLPRHLVRTGSNTYVRAVSVNDLFAAGLVDEPGDGRYVDADELDAILNEDDR